MGEPRLVYHYCTVETLMHILQNRCLRLSDLEKSNDYAERKWMQEMISDEFCKMIQDNHELGQGFRFCVRKFVEKKNLYASCFSEKPDLLSQWRAYAMDGRGVAIGFVKNCFDGLSKGNNDLEFLKIAYDYKEQKKFARLQAERLYEMLLKGSELEAAVSRIYGMAEIELSIMKNPAFEEEQEWRICMASAPEADGKKLLLEEGFLLSPVQLYYSNYRLITYYELDFLKREDELVKEIILGPKCRLEERDVRMCLRLWGYEVEHVQIRRSGATYC